jgi:hypothetical protein
MTQVKMRSWIVELRYKRESDSFPRLFTLVPGRDCSYQEAIVDAAHELRRKLGARGACDVILKVVARRISMTQAVVDVMAATGLNWRRATSRVERYYYKKTGNFKFSDEIPDVSALEVLSSERPLKRAVKKEARTEARS